MSRTITEADLAALIPPKGLREALRAALPPHTRLSQLKHDETLKLDAGSVAHSWLSGSVLGRRIMPPTTSQYYHASSCHPGGCGSAGHYSYGERDHHRHGPAATRYYSDLDRALPRRRWTDPLVVCSTPLRNADAPTCRECAKFAPRGASSRLCA